MQKEQDFFTDKKRKFDGQVRQVTPMDDMPDLTNLLVLLTNIKLKFEVK